LSDARVFASREPRQAFGARRKRVWQGLDRAVAIELRVAPAKDLAHAPLADRRGDRNILAIHDIGIRDSGPYVVSELLDDAVEASGRDPPWCGTPRWTAYPSGE